MVEWAVSETGIWGFGRRDTVRIRATDWRPSSTSRGLPRSVDAAVSGSAGEIRFPDVVATVVGPNGPCSLARSERLPPGEYLLTFRGGERRPDGGESRRTGRVSTEPSTSGGVETLVRFAGPVRVERTGGEISLCFAGRSEVTVGFYEESVLPPTIRVPRTPAGAATAVTHAAAACQTTGPGRSHPANRDHPPLVTFGEEHVPASVGKRTPETAISLSLPADLESVFVAAPLAYYLGADVEVGSERPVLRTPDREHAFSRCAFADEVASVLRRLFYLDCYARETDGEGRIEPPVPGYEAALSTYGDRPIARRLGAVLDGEFASFEAGVPEWHLSTYVESRPSNVRALPYLLDRLSLVYPPDASNLDGQALLKRTLDDFYRGRDGSDFFRAVGNVATANRLDPDLRGGHVHEWLADGIPITACKTSIGAYENHLYHGTQPRERVSIDVVLNDREMLGERRVADIYRERAADLPVDVRVHESLTRKELASVFEAPTDFVHYVGHCEVDGLKCSDGALPTAELDVGTRTFFLNACGSYREGLGLVEGGAAAGAVTLTKVLNEQAATVGTSFARLLVNGFGIERALSLARRQIMMGQDYAVVGDGTHTLTPADGEPAVVHLSGGPAVYDVRYQVVTGRSAGRAYRSPFDGRQHLHGVESTTTLSRPALRRFLTRHDVPVLHEGEFYWADEFVPTLV